MGSNPDYLLKSFLHYILQFHPWATFSNTGKTFYSYSTFLETYRGVSFRLNRAVKSFQLPISKVQLLYFFYTYDLLLQLLKVRFDMSFAAFMVCSMFQYLWLRHKICQYQSCKHQVTYTLKKSYPVSTPITAGFFEVM